MRRGWSQEKNMIVKKLVLEVSEPLCSPASGIPHGSQAPSFPGESCRAVSPGLEEVRDERCYTERATSRTDGQ